MWETVGLMIDVVCCHYTQCRSVCVCVCVDWPLQREWSCPDLLGRKILYMKSAALYVCVLNLYSLPTIQKQTKTKQFSDQLVAYILLQTLGVCWKFRQSTTWRGAPTTRTLALGLWLLNAEPHLPTQICTNTIYYQYRPTVVQAFHKEWEIYQEKL